MLKSIPFYLSAAGSLWLTSPAMGQLSFSDGRNSLEIGAAFFPYYNYRFYPAAQDNHKKNNFTLRNAQLSLDGRIGRDVEFALEFNFAKVNYDDPENPALMDANFTYKGFRATEIKVGYMKVPYSRSSLVPYQYMPFIQRAVIGKGDIYSRRDVGVLLEKALLNQQLNLYGGIFSGLGEGVVGSAFAGDNDRSGNVEFIGRADYAWPARVRYREIDAVHVPVPMVQVGINARTANKQTPFAGDYAIKYVDGSRTAAGVDLSFQYRGISAQFEGHHIWARPRNRASLAYSNQDPRTGIVVYQDWSRQTSRFKAGGYLMQANYHIRPLRSVIAVRYDNFNANDLQQFDYSENLSFAYNYMLDGFRSVIKVQAWKRLRKDYVNGPTDDQVRLGWQYLFK